MCRSSQFYLVLDVNNLTAQEMMLNYTTNKNIVIEARESCRVPVPVERCPLFRRDQYNEENKDQTSKSADVFVLFYIIKIALCIE